MRSVSARSPPPKFNPSQVGQHDATGMATEVVQLPGSRTHRKRQHNSWGELVGLDCSVKRRARVVRTGIAHRDLVACGVKVRVLDT